MYSNVCPSSFFIVLSNMKYVTYGRSVVESKIEADGRESARRRKEAEGDEKKERKGDTHTKVSYRSSRNLCATIRVVVVSTAWIRNESNDFDALRDHE